LSRIFRAILNVNAFRESIGGDIFGRVTFAGCRTFRGCFAPSRGAFAVMLDVVVIASAARAGPVMP
jgi:hypothetical protein